MSKSFPLIILTPEREFFNDLAESITVESIGDQLTVLANHIPMVTSLSVGQLTIRTGDQVLKASHSEGFMEVRGDATILLCQACEWPHEIDVKRARDARERVKARLLEEQSRIILDRSKVALMRALIRIKLTSADRVPK